MVTHASGNSGCKPRLRARTRACCTARAGSSRTRARWHSTRFGAPRAFPLIPACLFAPAAPTDPPNLNVLQGTLTPLLGIGLCVSIQFGALEWTKRLFAAQNARNGRGGPDGATLSSGQLFLAGSFAGLANGVVSGPVEHIRISECSFCPRLSRSIYAPFSNTRDSTALSAGNRQRVAITLRACGYRSIDQR